MKQLYKYIFVGLILVGLLLIKHYTDNGNLNVNSNNFYRDTSLLHYSDHALCRMNCREVTEHEVKEIMMEGKINFNKSDLNNDRCPKYAVEGYTDDKQDLRIIFAQCDRETVVVTVIDLKQEHTCDCPGD